MSLQISFIYCGAYRLRDFEADGNFAAMRLKFACKVVNTPIKKDMRRLAEIIVELETRHLKTRLITN